MTAHKEKRNRNWYKFLKSEQGIHISPCHRILGKSIKMVRGRTCYWLLHNQDTALRKALNNCPDEMFRMFLR